MTDFRKERRNSDRIAVRGRRGVHLLRELHRLPPDVRVRAVLDRGGPPHRRRDPGYSGKLPDPRRSWQKQKDEFSSASHRPVSHGYSSGN